MDLDVLWKELDEDPLVRGYSGMSNEAAAADLNTTSRERNLASMTSSEVFQAIDVDEYKSLTETQQANIMHVLGFGSLNPFGQEAALFIDHFGAGSETLTALQALRKEAVSRGVELGLGKIKPGHVEEARR